LNARFLLKTKLQDAFHFLWFVAFHQSKLKDLTGSILKDSDDKNTNIYFDKIMKLNLKQQFFLNENLCNTSERDAVTLHEILRLKHIHAICPSFTSDMLNEFAYSNQLIPSSIKKFFKILV
jgi:hypothetical protein